MPIALQRRGRQVVRVRRRRVVVERLVVRDVVVLVAVLTGAAQCDADRRHGVADALVRRVRDAVLEPGVLELVRDERRRRLARVAGRGERVGVRGARPEAALEPTPGDAVGVEQVADVLALQRNRVARRAVVPVRLRVARERVAAETVRRDVRVRLRGRRDRRAVRVCAMSTSPVSPDTTLIAPGADGPNVVEYELSLIAKCCA